MKKFILFFSLLFITLFSVKISAYNINKDTKIYVSGETIGIKLETGVMVMGTYGINDADNVLTPWKDANIKEGDIITKFNDIEIKNTKGLLTALQKSNGNLSTISVKRNNNIIDGIVTPARIKNTYSLGIYIKDHIMGVGTLTYIIPDVNIYGALGHSIVDSESYGGEIYEATVDKIIKPGKQTAGEKRATITSDGIGNISSNTITGIHGYMNNDFNKENLQLLNIATRNEVKIGKAQILTCINGTDVKLYDIKITGLEKQKTKDIKGIKFKVTDKELLSKSGGVVQGMSGSPIIQDDKIIGAVTHVLLNDSTSGYGIYIEFMLEDMGVYIVD